MEEWILLVLGKAGGVPDFKILVQIQVSRWSAEMVEALAHGSFRDVLGPVSSIKMLRKRFPNDDRVSHRHIEILGIEKEYEVAGVKQKDRINDFWIYIQLPNNHRDTADQAVTHMINSPYGLRGFLGPYCKNITFHKASETHVWAFEELGGGIVVK